MEIMNRNCSLTIGSSPALSGQTKMSTPCSETRMVGALECEQLFNNAPIADLGQMARVRQFQKMRASPPFRRRQVK